MSQTLTIVVTGANRGIGQGIIQLLACTTSTLPFHIIATSRSGNDLNISATSPNSVSYAKLDISSSSSIKSFFQETHHIDVLINNAGVNNNDNETPELAAQTIDVNYKGTRDMCIAALRGGTMKRIVNVSSTASNLNNYDKRIQDRFQAVNNIADVDDLAKDYVESIKAGGNAQNEAGFGSPPKSYQVSKALMNALTVVLAKKNPDILINCCCPGWVDTDMGHQVGKPPKTLEEGARIPVRLAVGELGKKGDANGGVVHGNVDASEKVSGRYFGNESVSGRGWGKVREW